MVTNATRTSPKRPTTFWLVGLLLVVVAVVAVLELTNTTHLFHKDLGSGGIPSTSPTKTTKPAVNNTSSTSDQTKTAVNNSATITTGGPPPQVPTGNFVSNHRPGGSAPTSEASTCNTTPGAVCYIQFTKGSITKKLDAQTTGKDGGAIWYWDVKSAGLEAGSWKVTAVATLNGQTQTADDGLALEVQ